MPNVVLLQELMVHSSLEPAKIQRPLCPPSLGVKRKDTARHHFSLLGVLQSLQWGMCTEHSIVVGLTFNKFHIHPHSFTLPFIVKLLECHILEYLQSQ